MMVIKAGSTATAAAAAALAIAAAVASYGCYHEYDLSNCNSSRVLGHAVI
jgi:hypothetical protein